MSTPVNVPRRSALLVMSAIVGSLALAGCGDSGSAGPYAGGRTSSLSAEQQKQDYAAALERMMVSMEDENAPPVERSIQTANRKELLANTLRWDQALATLEGADPPKDAKPAHDKLVQAMRDLSAWNQRIAKAAPNKARTRRIAKQALNSPAAASYGEALAQLEALGYLPAGEPLEGASPPVG